LPFPSIIQLPLRAPIFGQQEIITTIFWDHAEEWVLIGADHLTEVADRGDF